MRLSPATASGRAGTPLGAVVEPYRRYVGLYHGESCRTCACTSTGLPPMSRACAAGSTSSDRAHRHADPLPRDPRGLPARSPVRAGRLRLKPLIPTAVLCPGVPMLPEGSVDHQARGGVR